MGTSVRRLPKNPYALRALVVTAWSGAVAGALILLLAPVTGRQDDSRVAPSVKFPVEIGSRVSTSLGTMSVDSAARLAGPPQATNLRLAPGEIPIQAAVTVVNASARPVRWSGSAFRLVGPAGGPGVGAGAGDVAPSVLPARRARRYVLRFAIPSRGALPSLEFRDPGGSAPIRFSLGSRDSLPVFDHTTHSTGPDGRPHPAQRYRRRQP